MSNVFASRSLNVIDDLSINERRYFFKKVKELKDAIISGNEEVMDSFRLNDPDFGVYEVFLEDSTRTKESFRNAAAFHHVKVSELITSSSSINKGESYADTFNMLSGYHNSIFIVRSRVEGLTKWLSEECSEYAGRNGLPYRPAFLRIFDHVKVDLIAPDELMMPESYIEKMKENGFDVSIYPSIEEYLKAGDPARLWYFTRPQLERMGERILQKQEILREAITFRRDFLPMLKENTKFYHPLPRHKEHPTIPTWLDKTPLNAWERQAINGMYCRIVLLSLIGGRIGDDYVPVPGEHVTDRRTEEYIIQVEPSSEKKTKNYSEGVRPITDGIVIDHICKGDDPGSIRSHMRLISSILGLDDGKGGEWVSKGSDGQYKGIIFRPGARPLERKDLKRLAAVAPHCTLNIIRDGRVAEKYRTHMPPRIYNFDDLCCQNEACISNPVNGEGVPASFYRTPDGHFACAYCGRFHTFKEIWKKRS